MSSSSICSRCITVFQQQPIISLIIQLWTQEVILFGYLEGKTIGENIMNAITVKRLCIRDQIMVWEVSRFTQFTQLFEFGNQSLNLSVVEVERVQDLESLIADGIIGLSKQYPDSDANLIDLLYNHTIIDAKQFGLLLSDQICSANSLLTLGKPNTSNYVGQLQYVNTTKSDLWNVYANSVLISNGSHQQMLESNKQLILFDSGTSKIMLSTRKFHSLHNIFNDDYNLHCEQYVITLLNSHIQSQISILNQTQLYFPKITSPIADIVINNNSQLKSILNYDFRQYNYFLQYRCYLNFQNLDNDDEIILGVVFLQKYYTHYDLEAKQVGIAQSIYSSCIKDIQITPKMTVLQDKLSVSELGNQYNYNMLYLSFMSIPILVMMIILSMNIIRMKQNSDEMAQSSEGGRQQRGQEQEMEPITFSVQSAR